MIAVDGEDLTYRNTVTYEAMHQNLEVLFDSDTYFREYNSFVNVSRQPRDLSIDRVIAKIFADFDTNKDGKLLPEEVKEFLKAKLGSDFDESEVQKVLTSLDKGGKGHVDRADLEAFLTK